MKLEAVIIGVPFEYVLEEMKRNISGDILATRNPDSKKFIYFQDGSRISFDQARNNALRLANECTILPHIDCISFNDCNTTDGLIYAQDATVMIGWQPDQAEMFASNWVIYKVIKEDEK